MRKKHPSIELSVSPQVAGRYSIAAKSLKAKFTAAAPTTAEKTRNSKEFCFF
jgi:hypothetical protein